MWYFDYLKRYPFEKWSAFFLVVLLGAITREWYVNGFNVAMLLFYIAGVSYVVRMYLLYKRSKK
jgi:hypothetical protein